MCCFFQDNTEIRRLAALGQKFSLNLENSSPNSIGSGGIPAASPLRKSTPKYRMQLWADLSVRSLVAGSRRVHVPARVSLSETPTTRWIAHWTRLLADMI